MALNNEAWNASECCQEMYDHLQALCDGLERTHGIRVTRHIARDGAQRDGYEVALLCEVEGSIAAAHAKALKMAELAEQLGLVGRRG